MFSFIVVQIEVLGACSQMSSQFSRSIGRPSSSDHFCIYRCFGGSDVGSVLLYICDIRPLWYMSLRHRVSNRVSGRNLEV
ncbi:hypothetical protein FKM82_024343 [Ascaphus truei]